MHVSPRWLGPLVPLSLTLCFPALPPHLPPSPSPLPLPFHLPRRSTMLSCTSSSRTKVAGAYQMPRASPSARPTGSRPSGATSTRAPSLLCALPPPSPLLPPAIHPFLRKPHHVEGDVTQTTQKCSGKGPCPERNHHIAHTACAVAARTRLWRGRLLSCPRLHQRLHPHHRHRRLSLASLPCPSSLCRDFPELRPIVARLLGRSPATPTSAGSSPARAGTTVSATPRARKRPTRSLAASDADTSASSDGDNDDGGSNSGSSDVESGGASSADEASETEVKARKAKGATNHRRGGNGTSSGERTRRLRRDDDPSPAREHSPAPATCAAAPAPDSLRVAPDGGSQRGSGGNDIGPHMGGSAHARESFVLWVS